MEEIKIDYYIENDLEPIFLRRVKYKNMPFPPRIGESVSLTIDDTQTVFRVLDITYYTGSKPHVVLLKPDK